MRGLGMERNRESMMKGLGKHSHDDRLRVIENMVPVIRRKFGDNLVGLAAQASFARNEDTGYSDLEMIAFVKEMPAGKKWDGMGRIVDGLMVELVWTTKETYLKETKDVGKLWYIAGSDTLAPVINEHLIAELNSFQPENLREKCLKQAVEHWYEVHEATAKVLNALDSENREGLPLLLSDMILHMLIVLSFLNRTPYVTFARFIEQARAFRTKPEGMDRLLDILVLGRYQDLIGVRKAVSEVFSGFEDIFEREGCEVYDDNLDPDRPALRGFD
jgi:hypothetical protein